MQNNEVKQEISMDLVHQGIGDTLTMLEITRAIFDQLPRFQMQQLVINTIQADIPTTHLHFVCSARKPEVPNKFFHECLCLSLHQNWIAAAKTSIEKNQRVAAFLLPFDRTKIDKDEGVFSKVLVPEVKQTDIPGILELRIEECIVGTK